MRAGFSAASLFLAGWLPLQSRVEVDVNLINVFLTVHDASGGYVTGLDRGDFRVYEDGELRTIEVLETGDDVQSSLGLLIDTSGSSADILRSIRAGVLAFAEGLRDEDEIFVMAFGTDHRVIHDFQDPRGRLSGALDRLESWGTSVFFDALDSGIEKVAAAEGPRKALIVLTDGEDNGSRTIYGDVVRAAERGMVTLYFIGMGPPVLVDTHTLVGLASLTGGRVVLMDPGSSPREALEAIHEELSRQYYLAYYSPAGPGSHSIRVEVPDRDVTVRARDGFFVEPE